MNSRTLRTAPSWWLLILLLVSLLLATVTADTGRSAAITVEATPAAPQDLTRIESRLSQMEQRFYSIEASIRGLEQQTRLSGSTTARAERDPEVGLLRAEVESLRRRLAEIECGLVRVDERTLTPAAKEMRRNSNAAAAVDPCRLNAGAPLRLPTRP